MAFALGPTAMVASDQSGHVRPEERAHFRPDIEGLRAVAVIAVLLFHVGVPGAGGGFVGVDVFYVISGFLITGLLVRELSATSRIDLVGFYARRMRRLLPAALIVISVTVVASALILSRLRFPEVAADAAASALYVSNVRFALEATDYLASQEAPSPFLHFWSLGVEEQFYLLWPLVILVGGRVLSVGRLGILLALVALASFATSLVWTDTAAPWAFFSLPTRAWELAVGALIAVGALRLPRRCPERLAIAITAIGLALIAVSVVAIDASTPYPGTAALLPVVGTALVIMAGTATRAGPTRWLSMSGPRWLGRISYSLYLWHWPLLVLVPIALRSDGLPLRVGLAGVAVVLAALSTELVETPIRRERVLRVSPLRSVGLAGACSVAVAVAALGAGVAVLAPASSSGVLAGQGDRVEEPMDELAGSDTLEVSERARIGEPPDPVAASPVARIEALPQPLRSGPVPRGLQPPLESARKDLPRSYADGCHLDFASTEPGECAYGRRRGDTTVALIGDSHAAQWLPALERLADERGWRLLGFTKSGCPMVEVTVWNTALKREYRECDRWRRNVVERLSREGVDIAFVANADMYEVVDSEGRRGPAEEPALWRAGLTAALRAVAAVADRVVVVADTPRVGYDPLECLASSGDVEACAAASDEMLDPAYERVEAAAASEARVEWISANDWICPDAGCPLIRGRLLVFRDHHHLTATFAAALAPRIGTALDRVHIP